MTTIGEVKDSMADVKERMIARKDSLKAIAIKSKNQEKEFQFLIGKIQTIEAWEKEYQAY